MNTSRRIIPTISFYILFFISTSCYAAPAYESQTEMYLRAIWGLAIVVAIMLIIFALVRKRFSLIHNRSESKIKVLEMRPLMPKKTLCLVEVEGKQFLLGVTGEQINHLADIEKDKTTSFSDHLSTASNE